MKPRPLPIASATRAHDCVLGREGFLAAEDDAVDDDQRDEQAERAVHRRDERLEQHVADGDERGDDQDVGGDPHLVGNDLAHARHQEAGSDEHESVPAPMTRQLATRLVTASVGHRPSVVTRTGFSFQMPFANTLKVALLGVALICRLPRHARR